LGQPGVVLEAAGGLFEPPRGANSGVVRRLDR
jgi:hypothetical protein